MGEELWRGSAHQAVPRRPGRPHGDTNSSWPAASDEGPRAPNRGLVVGNKRIDIVDGQQPSRGRSTCQDADGCRVMYPSASFPPRMSVENSAVRQCLTQSSSNRSADHRLPHLPVAPTRPRAPSARPTARPRTRLVRRCSSKRAAWTPSPSGAAPSLHGGSHRILLARPAVVT